jgi:methyl-accepting chemotaxis protein
MDKTEATRGTPELLRELEAAARDARLRIRSDLEHLRGIVRDAAGRLDQSFRSLQDVLMQHRALLEATQSSLHTKERGGKSLAESSEALLREFVDEIVRVSRDSMRLIDQLSDLSGNVDGIVGCADGIDRLGRETRFIAFNARIETHRAGEAGRTFKVVADEVKRLANASVGLSSKIRDSVGLCRGQLEALNLTAQGLASHDMGEIASHQGLAQNLAKLDETHRAFDAILDRVESSVSMAVQTLQFEDMVTQLVGSCLSRIDSMLDLTIRAMWVVERGSNGDRTAPLREAIEAMRKLAAHGATQQPGPDRGSVELF